MDRPRVIILGAGPAGLGAAWKLARQGRAAVTVLERNQAVGGNAGSFDLNGIRVDFGSHRLHPASDAGVLHDIRELLGDDLLDRPRHGRIRLRGRWIHFPLKPADLLLHLDPGFTIGTLRDMARKGMGRAGDEGETFASVLMANLGPTICREFYFPYAWKMWGRDPESLSGIQARRRVSAGSFMKLIRKVLSAVPGLKPKGSGRFFYPRKGFGQISEAYADAARKAGADIRLGTTVTGLKPPADEAAPWIVTTTTAGKEEALEADYVWSTIPITILARAMGDHTPAEVREAARAIDYRSMILVYLELGTEQFTPFDAHYFPGSDIRITRLSEPRNYAARTEPADRTVICAELPCGKSDDVWNMSDDELGKLVSADLARSGIPLPVEPMAVHTRRLPQAYPIYQRGYEKPFGVLDSWADSLPRLLTYGRQGLFAHDNTHHALYMAYAAVDCLRNGDFDHGRWEKYREEFSRHVVED